MAGKTNLKRSGVRDFDQINEKDCLWPQNLGDDRMWFPFKEPLYSRRYEALFEILSTISNADYQALKEKVGSFEWFVPEEDNSGIYSFHSKILYLGPGLDTMDYALVLAIVAHELAHIAIGHFVDPNTSNEERVRQEGEAWVLVCKWGFADEVKKYFLTNKNGEIAAGGFSDRRIEQILKPILNPGSTQPRKKPRKGVS